MREGTFRASRALMWQASLSRKVGVKVASVLACRLSPDLCSLISQHRSIAAGATAGAGSGEQPVRYGFLLIAPAGSAAAV